MIKLISSRPTKVLAASTAFFTAKAFDSESGFKAPFHPKKEWWEDEGGLNFECTSCGKCCTIQGQILANHDEVSAIVKELDMSDEEFQNKHIETGNGSWFVLKSKPTQKDGSEPCSLLGEDGRCTVYDARPTQCRTYPFWDEMIASRETWEKEAVLTELMAIDQERVSGVKIPSSTSAPLKLGQKRRWGPIDGGCEGINRPDSSTRVPLEEIRAALEEQRTWDKDLGSHLDTT